MSRAGTLPWVPVWVDFVTLRTCQVRQCRTTKAISPIPGGMAPTAVSGAGGTGEGRSKKFPTAWLRDTAVAMSLGPSPAGRGSCLFPVLFQDFAFQVGSQPASGQNGSAVAGPIRFTGSHGEKETQN